MYWAMRFATFVQLAMTIEHRGERGQQNERHGDAVDADVEVRVDGRDPGRVLDELHVRGGGVEARSRAGCSEET